MKNINTVIVHREKNENAGSPSVNRPHPWPRCAALCAVLALAGGCTLRQAYPETQIRGYINGQPFAVNAPKDSALIGFDAIAETNGAVHVHIDSLQSSLNPTNLATAATGQAAIVTAIAQALNQALQTGSAVALKAAGMP